MDKSYPKGGHVKLQREFKFTVLSVNRLACASWYSMNGQNDEFQTDVDCHKIFTACAGNRGSDNLNQYLVLKLKATS